MSLVEKALRKLQSSAPVVAPAGAVPRGDVEVAVAAPAGSTARASQDLEATGRLVSVNVAALRASGLLPPEHEERELAQQFRHIKRPLIANALGRGAPRLPSGTLIMVASAMPGEGKTFTAFNLAISMSLEKDVRVVLVDADVAKPHISRVLGIGDAPGLLDVLREPRLEVESVILRTDIPNLSVMSAGTASSDATELLASARMAQVVRNLGKPEDRIVLFDSPPLLHTTESHAVVQVSGQVVVVVRAGVTSQHVLTDVLEHLKDHRAVSLVLNESVLSADSAYYYSGYGESRSEPAA